MTWLLKLSTCKPQNVNLKKLVRVNTDKFDALLLFAKCVIHIDVEENFEQRVNIKGINWKYSAINKSSHPQVFFNYLFRKNLQKSQQNIFTRVSFSIKLWASSIALLDRDSTTSAFQFFSFFSDKFFSSRFL